MIKTSLNKSMPIKRGAITPDNILSFIEKEYDAGNKEKVMKLAKMMNDKCISLSRENKVLKGEWDEIL